MADTGWQRAGGMLVRRVGSLEHRVALRVWPGAMVGGHEARWSVDRIVRVRAGSVTVDPVTAGEAATTAEARRAAEAAAARELGIEVPALEPGRVGR